MSVNVTMLVNFNGNNSQILFRPAVRLQSLSRPIKHTNIGRFIKTQRTRSDHGTLLVKATREFLRQTRMPHSNGWVRRCRKGE